jgi:hypothetical protein
MNRLKLEALVAFCSKNYLTGKSSRSPDEIREKFKELGSFEKVIQFFGKEGVD